MRPHRTLIALFCLSLTAPAVVAQSYPNPMGRVSDFARVLSTEAASRLDADLAQFEQQTSIEIAVVTVTSLGGQSIESYTRGLATAWGVGKRWQDNGVVLLVAPAERKVRIQTATGARSRLSDSRADVIRDRDLLPAFRAGDLAGGIVRGTHAIMTALGEPAAPEPPVSPAVVAFSPPPAQVSDRGGILKTLMIAIFAVSLLAALLVYRRLRAQRVVNEQTALATARIEGPRLMREMPDLIASAEKTMAERPDSPRAARLLEQARNNYAEAQRMQSGAGVLDWMLFHSLLESSRQTCEQASMPDPPPVARAPAFMPDPSSASTTPSSTDFGGGGGFDAGGGGGGADSSGGGSSGSW